MGSFITYMQSGSPFNSLRISERTLETWKNTQLNAYISGKIDTEFLCVYVFGMDTKHPASLGPDMHRIQMMDGSATMIWGAAGQYGCHSACLSLNYS